VTAADETASPTAVATERVTGLRSRIDPARLRAWLLEMTRFLIVGGASFVVDLGLYNLLVFGPGQPLGHKPITAKVIATAIATLASWLGNRNWTFADQRTDRRGRELLIYGALNVVGALVPIGTLAFSRYVLHLAGPLEDNIATILGIAAATILRYVGYKLWVFTGKSEASRAAEPTPAS
jgi:putative flippase GtrA